MIASCCSTSEALVYGSNRIEKVRQDNMENLTLSVILTLRFWTIVVSTAKGSVVPITWLILGCSSLHIVSGR